MRLERLLETQVVVSVDGNIYQADLREDGSAGGGGFLAGGDTRGDAITDVRDNADEKIDHIIAM